MKEEVMERKRKDGKEGRKGGRKEGRKERRRKQAGGPLF